MKHFSVSGTLRQNPNRPPGCLEGKKYEVVADDALCAVKLCLQKYPGFNINAIVLNGEIDVIQEGPLR